MDENPFKELAKDLKTAEQHLRSRLLTEQEKVQLQQQQESNFLDEIAIVIAACQQATLQFNQSYGQEKLRLHIPDAAQAINRMSGSKYATHFAITGVGCFVRLLINIDITHRALQIEFQKEVKSEAPLPKSRTIYSHFNSAVITGWEEREKIVNTTELGILLVKAVIEQETSIRHWLSQSPPAHTPNHSSNIPSRSWWHSLWGKRGK